MFCEEELGINKNTAVQLKQLHARNLHQKLEPRDKIRDKGLIIEVKSILTKLKNNTIHVFPQQWIYCRPLLDDAQVLFGHSQ